MKLQLLALIIGLLTTPWAMAQEVVDVSAKACSPGVHKQPSGPFALYVFCDDALGTNVAVFLNDLGAPLAGKYDLGRRFWQGEKWGYDVTSYAWLDDGKHLLIATSGIYGSGAVFMLNLESQTHEVKLPLQHGACLSRLKNVENGKVEVGITNCEDRKEHIVKFSL